MHWTLVATSDRNADGCLDLEFADPVFLPQWDVPERGGSTEYPDLPRPEDVSVPGFAVIGVHGEGWSAAHPDAVASVEAWCPEPPSLREWVAQSAADATILACAMWRGATPESIGRLLYSGAPLDESGGQFAPTWRPPGFAMNERAPSATGLPPLSQGDYIAGGLHAPSPVDDAGCVIRPSYYFWDWVDSLRLDNGEFYRQAHAEALLSVPDSPSDVDGDGRAEVIVTHLWAHGPGGGGGVLFVSGGGCPRYVGGFFGHGRIRVLPESDHGLQRFRSWLGQGCLGAAGMVNEFRFDGERYQQTRLVDCPCPDTAEIEAAAPELCRNW